MITQTELKQILHYDPLTGIFTWLVSKGRTKSGSIAGGIDKVSGYHQITINEKKFFAHRLAWLYVHSYFPTSTIDHRDRNRSNNKIDNLREASRAEQNQNIGLRKDNKTGCTGVYQLSSGKWSASIGKAGEYKNLGTFDTKQEAKAARKEAELKYHPFKKESAL